MLIKRLDELRVSDENTNQHVDDLLRLEYTEVALVFTNPMQLKKANYMK